MKSMKGRRFTSRKVIAREAIHCAGSDSWGVNFREIRQESDTLGPGVVGCLVPFVCDPLVRPS